MKSKSMKLICLVIVFSLCMSVLVFAEDDGQNPVMNVIGNYACDRASVNVAPLGDDMAEITIRWGASAFEEAVWTMSGVFDTDTLTIDCSDCTKKVIAYDMDADVTGAPPTETTEYTDGSAKIIFGEGGTLTWDDGQEHIADGMVFEFVSIEAEAGKSFAADMTYQTKYIMYVGTNDKDTYEPAMPYEEARELANNICAKYVSGYTQTDAMGGWLDDNGMLTQENTLIYIFFDATEEQLQNIMDELIEALNQSSILIEKQEVLYTFYSGD